MGKKISQLDAITTAGIDEPTDLVAVFDTTANKLKKISVEDFLALVPGFDITSLPNLSPGDVQLASDKLVVFDASAGAAKVLFMNDFQLLIAYNIGDLASIAVGDIVEATDLIAIHDATAGVDKSVSVQDFLTLAGGGGLTLFTENTGTMPFGSKTYNQLLATGAETNIDAVFSPKGSGAIVASVAFLSDRGAKAVDLQMTVASSVDVAAATHSGITHGLGNAIDSAASYARAGGRYAAARRFAEDVWAGGSSANTSGYGDQMSKMVLYETITGVDPTELSADTSTTKRIEMAGTDSLIRVVIDLVATCIAPGNGTTVLTEVYSTSKAVVVHISAGVSTIVGTTTYGTAITQTSMADCDLTFDIDAGTQDLKVLFTPPTTAGTTTITRVVASAHITELYGH